jgi:hypothetical protein
MGNSLRIPNSAVVESNNLLTLPPMTAQEKIQELAMAALRSAPPAPGVPKPATFMADAEKLRAAIPVAVPAAPEAKAGLDISSLPVAEAKPAPQSEALPFKDEGDPELRAMIEARDAQKAKSLKRNGIAVSCTFLALLVAGGTWFAVSPSAQAKVARVVPLFKESVRDARSLADTKENFDKSLEKVAGHGQFIDEATRSLGADPNSVTKEQEAELDASMKQMMGGEGRTTSERNKELQQKLGAVGELLEKKGS